MRNKEYLNQLNKYYFKAPIRLYTMSLSVEAIGLYTYIASCSEAYNPSIRRVSKVLSMGTKRIKKAYDELERRNVIKCIHKGYKNTTKKYEFVHEKLWKV